MDDNLLEFETFRPIAVGSFLERLRRIQPSLQAIESGSYGLIQLAGIASWFLTFLAYFLTNIEAVGVLSYLILLCFVYGIGWALHAKQILNRLLANAIQFVCLTLVLGTEVFFDDAAKNDWIPVTVITLTLFTFLSLQIASWFVIPLLLIFGLGIKLLVSLDFTSLLYGGAKFLDGWVAAGYLVVVGITSWLAKHLTVKQSKKFDASLSQRIEQLREIRESEIQREVNQHIVTRMHETLLNTLNALSRINLKKQINQVREIIRRDLVDLNQLTHTLHPMSLEELITEALDRVDLENINITITANEEVEVSTETLGPLLASVIEVFRNVQRHSNANNLSVSWQLEKDYLKLEVTDDGIGFDVASRLGTTLGLAVIVQNKFTQLGHKVEIDSKIGNGTTVTWLLSDFNTRNTRKDFLDWPRLNEENSSFRYIFALVPIYMFLLIVKLSSEFINQNLIVCQFILYIILLITFARLNSAKARYFLAIPLVAVVFWGQLSLIGQTDNCTDAQPIQWIINGYTFGILLLVLMLKNFVQRALTIFSNFLIVMLVATSLGKCQEIALLPGLTGVVVSIGIVYGLARLRRGNEDAISLYETVFHETMETKYRQDAVDRSTAILSRITTSTRDLLDKTLHSDDTTDFTKLRHDFEIEESYLRSAILIMKSSKAETQQSMLDLLTLLHKNDCTVSVEVWVEEINVDSWPAEVLIFANRLASNLINGECKIVFHENNSHLYAFVDAIGTFTTDLTKYEFVHQLSVDKIRAEIDLGIMPDRFEQIAKPHQQ